MPTPDPENIYITVETRCPECDGTGHQPITITHSFQGKPFRLACDKCGATGYVKVRMSALEWAEALVKLMERLPNMPWRSKKATLGGS